MPSQRPPVVCAISASDSSGHAGNQCDLRVIQDLGCHGTSVITGITAQNSKSITGVESTDHSILSEQLNALLVDIPMAAIKTGLLLSAEQIDTLIETLSNPPPLIVDPVFATSSGKAFESEALIKGYQRLLAITDLFTPNLPEAQQLLDTKIVSDEDVVLAAKAFRQQGAKAVLIKGGHRDTNNFVFDYFDNGEQQFWLRQERQASNNTRGTGCTLASAVASFVAQGKAVVDAVVLANAYVHQGIRQGFSIGDGNGLLGNRGWPSHFSDYPTILKTRSDTSMTKFAACDTRTLGLYPIVDSLKWLERLLTLGVKTLQLRVKNVAEDQLDSLIRDAVGLGKDHNARLFINDHWQLAIKHDAYGVHLGQEDMDEAQLNQIQSNGLRLGLSSHSEYEWMRAASLNPSYIAMGSVFPTSTKSVKTIGLKNLERWVDVVNQEFPTVAIGGINLDNLDKVIDTQVGSCAVISTITASEDYQSVTRELIKKLDKKSSGYPSGTSSG